MLSAPTVWDTSCLNWEERFLSGKSLIPDLPLFQDEADRALRIFKRLQLPDVIGNPTMEVASGEWFFSIVAALFGSYDPSINKRMIQEFFLLVPKKNGKSSYAAAIMVVAIIVNRRPAAEFLLIAPTKEIADIAFKQASGIIKLDPELTKLFQIQQHVRTITHRKTDASIKIKAADTDVITGAKSTGILVDETHVFSKKSDAADVFVEVRGALLARPDGFMIQISTQSKQPPAGVFKVELSKAREVRDGKLKLPLLPILYEIPYRLAKDSGWQNKAYWPLVNPNMGRSVRMDFLENELISARDDVTALALLASQHFNVEIGMGLSTDRWPGADFWDRPKNTDKTLTLETLLARCEVAVIGVDGGGLDDLLGLVVIGRETGTRRWLWWSKAWAHKIVLTRRKSIAPKLLDLEKEGSLVLVEDESDDDLKQVADIVEQVRDAGLLPEENAIGVDPSGISLLIDELERREFSASTEEKAGQIAAVRQGYITLNDTTKTAERRLAQGEIVHEGSELMKWCVSNAKLEKHGNAVVITKQAAGVAKIDPLMAGFNAVALMSKNPAPARSAYEDDDFAI